MNQALASLRWWSDGPKRYLFAFLAMALALAVRGILEPSLGPHHAYVTLFAATAFSAWYCGVWPATLAAISGVIVANFYFIPPLGRIGLITRQDIAGTIAYLIASVAVIALGESNRRSMLRLAEVQEELLLSRSQLLASHSQLENRVRERTAELELANRGLRNLSARLLRVQDEEQRRIARELHDSTGQALAALGMNLSKLQRDVSLVGPSSAQIAAESLQICRQVSDELRTISYLLHPPLLDEMGLQSALRWYLDGFQKRSGITTVLEMPDALGRLAQELELTIYRIVQTALVNIHRHAKASLALVRLLHSGAELSVEISDNGVGIPPEMLAKIESSGMPGVGLRGARERVKDFNGAFRVASTGGGTTVRLTFPVPQPAPPVSANDSSGVHVQAHSD